jgi:hypothetical protein
MGTKIDLTGQIFGNFRVISDAGTYISPSGSRQVRMWLCECLLCGGPTKQSTANLKSGVVKSCGCTKKVDMIGRRFGKLTVIEEIEPIIYSDKKMRNFLCECDCGKTREVSRAHLQDGSAKSCGCDVKINSIGTQFGYLTAIEYVEPAVTPGGRIIPRIRCECACGNDKIVREQDLRSGRTQSCGCKHKEAAAARSKLDLIGKRFGKLTVMRPTSKRRSRQVLFECGCDCGGTTYANSVELQSGKKVSCGCENSVGETKIASSLAKIGIEYEREKTYSSCFNDKTNQRLRFDFLISASDLLIEFDGPQHEKYEPNGWNTYENYVETVYRDGIKNRWCRENNKQLIRIPYTERHHIDAAYMLTLMRLAAMEEDEELVCPA